MNKRVIARLMQQRVEGLGQSRGYFFRGAFEHVLRGVLFEYVPDGVYIWNFRFPLFDFFGENLLYSNRLEGRFFFAKGELSEAGLVESVLAQPEIQEAFRPGPPMSLHQFLQFVEASDVLLNEHGQFIFAVGLVVAREEERAREMMEEILPRLPKRDAENCRRLLACLDQGIDAAISLLGEVRQANLKAFGLA